jgi:fatty-acyl-CoA synthase
MLRDLAPELAACHARAAARKRLPELRTVIQLGDARRRRLFVRRGHGPRRRGQPGAARRHLAQPPPDDADQHPVHLRHHGRAQGRDAHPPQHRQQRDLFWPRAMGSGPTTGSASRCRSITASAWCSATSPRSPYGATMVFPGEAFDPGETLQALAGERCTAVHGVPTMFAAMLDHPASPSSTSPRCAPASWRAPPAPIR